MQDAHGGVDVKCARAASVTDARTSVRVIAFFLPFFLFQHLCSLDLSRVLTATFLVPQFVHIGRKTSRNRKPAKNRTMSDLNGKRKRIETVDLTADDTDAPVKTSKRQEISSTPTPQQRSNTNQAGSSNITKSNVPGLSYPFNGHSFSASGSHTEAERRDWLNEDEDDINETIGSTQLDAANGTDELHLYGDLDTKIVGVQYYRGFAC